MAECFFFMGFASLLNLTIGLEFQSVFLNDHLDFVEIGAFNPAWLSFYRDLRL